jgi:uncharacterized protein (DUF433 family)
MFCLGIYGDKNYFSELRHQKTKFRKNKFFNPNKTTSPVFTFSLLSTENILLIFSTIPISSIIPTRNSEVMGGQPCIRGMRVTVGTIVDLMASSGHSLNDIIKAYPYLEEADIYEALAAF